MPHDRDSVVFNRCPHVSHIRAGAIDLLYSIKRIIKSRKSFFILIMCFWIQKIKIETKMVVPFLNPVPNLFQTLRNPHIWSITIYFPESAQSMAFFIWHLLNFYGHFCEKCVQIMKGVKELLLLRHWSSINLFFSLFSGIFSGIQFTKFHFNEDGTEKKRKQYNESDAFFIWTRSNIPLSTCSSTWNEMEWNHLTFN